eukprot:symbB.v1.2.019872.t1/scaffold1647.1/size107771/8
MLLSEGTIDLDCTSHTIFRDPLGEILELDHLQLLLRQRRGHGVDDVEPLMLGVTEIEELAWRFWRQYVATAEATEEVQELLIQHEVFQESLVCAVCREALTSHGVGEHLRSPRHFRKLLWWLLQGDLLSSETKFSVLSLVFEIGSFAYLPHSRDEQDGFIQS